MSIAELFRKLNDCPSGHTYTAARIEGWENVYLGVTLAAQPCLLVRAGGRSVDPPLRTARVTLRPGQEFSLAIDGGMPTRQLFHMLCCESSDRVETESFLILIEAFLARYAGQEIDGGKLTSFFRSMVRLFAVTPARDIDAERQGLWGELFVMRQARGFRFWAPFWHSEVTRVFDFSAYGRRVEVKTTAGVQRVHHFSHRQIYALADEEIVIASLLLREDDAGLSLRDLLSQAREELRGTEDYLKLERAVRRASMEDPSISGPAYDEASALRELTWFRSVDAPHFRMPEPPGVSETRYKADLSTAPALSRDELNKWLDNWVLSSIAAAQIRGGV